MTRGQPNDPRARMEALREQIGGMAMSWQNVREALLAICSVLLDAPLLRALEQSTAPLGASGGETAGPHTQQLETNAGAVVSAGSGEESDTYQLRGAATPIGNDGQVTAGSTATVPPTLREATEKADTSGIYVHITQAKMEELRREGLLSYTAGSGASEVAIEQDERPTATVPLFKQIGVRIDVDWWGNWAAHSFNRESGRPLTQGAWCRDPELALDDLRLNDPSVSALLDAPLLRGEEKAEDDWGETTQPLVAESKTPVRAAPQPTPPAPRGMETETATPDSNRPRVERWAVLGQTSILGIESPERLIMTEAEARNLADALDHTFYDARFAPHRVVRLVELRTGEEIRQGDDIDWRAACQQTENELISMRQELAAAGKARQAIEDELDAAGYDTDPDDPDSARHQVFIMGQVIREGLTVVDDLRSQLAAAEAMNAQQERLLDQFRAAEVEGGRKAELSHGEVEGVVVEKAGTTKSTLPAIPVVVWLGRRPVWFTPGTPVLVRPAVPSAVRRLAEEGGEP